MKVLQNKLNSNFIHQRPIFLVQEIKSKYFSPN